MSPRRVIAALSLAACLAVPTGIAQAAAPSPSSREDRLQLALDELVADPNGPPGVIVLVQLGEHRRVFRAGVANVETDAPMRPAMHMRIASTAKAYSGGVALALVEQGVMTLDATVGDLLAWAPPDWQRVTLAQALHHTSGIPDFSADAGFQQYLVEHLDESLRPRQLLGFVTDEDLEFEPDSRYRYSNSDNIVVALMVAAATGHPYTTELHDQVLERLALDATSLPRGVEMPRPLIRGYDREDDGTPIDVSELVAAGWAWASGGIVSTPTDQTRFIRAYVGRQLFGGQTQDLQFDFIAGGRSEPPGPGQNSAGLAVYRYRLACGTAFGHTGNTLGYTQFMAASRSGARSVVVAINRQSTKTVAPEVYAQLRNVFRLGTCVALDGTGG